VGTEDREAGKQETQENRKRRRGERSEVGGPMSEVGGQGQPEQPPTKKFRKTGREKGELLRDGVNRGRLFVQPIRKD
jgi:hypothetical protein